MLIDDWLLHRALLWKGSPALNHQLVYLRDRRLPASLLNAQQEMVVAAAQDDPLLHDLQMRGFTVTPNASQAAWANAGKGFRTPGRTVFRIYFARPRMP